MEKALEKLSSRTCSISSSDVSDALVRMFGDFGYLPNIRIVSPRDNMDVKVIGPVYPVQLVPELDETSPRPGPSHPNFVDDAPEGCILFINQPESCVNAVWGGLLATRAKKRGVLGTVVNGQCRDVREHHLLSLPVFAKGTSSLGAAMFTRVSTINQSVTVKAPPGTSYRDVVVNPGDIIFGDVDGVVRIPRQHLEAVVEKADIIVKQDSACMNAIQNGMSLKEAFSTFRK